MSEGFNRTQITYHLGWACAIVAFLYKLLMYSSLGWSVASSTGLAPKYFLEASALLFLMCIATVARAHGLHR